MQDRRETTRGRVRQQVHAADQPETYPHAKIKECNCSVLLGATGSVLKDILNERYGLNKDDDKVIVLPPKLFVDGRSYADMEFLIYFNAYVAGNLFKDKPFQVVGTKAQCEAMDSFLRSTVFGPDWSKPETYPNIQGERREMFQKLSAYFAPKDKDQTPYPLEQYVTFRSFVPGGSVEVLLDKEGSSSLLIQDRSSDGIYKISAYKDLIHQNDYELPITYNHPKPNDIPLPPGTLKEINDNKYGFAVTCLGNSTGFDAKGLVTSFIVWTGGTGVLVDPSEDALMKIDELGLSHHEIPYCYLSHCHQDHDGGLLSRMLEGRTINLIASDIVYEEFMKKAELLLKFQGKEGTIDPRLLVNWIPCTPEDGAVIPTRTGANAVWKPWDNLHPIPTQGFSVNYLGKTFGHSGDTKYSEAFIDELQEKGVLTERQAKTQKELFFKDGRCKFDLLHMEAGAGSIHTDAGVIKNSLDESERNKVFFYHVPDTALPPDLEGMRKVGLGETQSILAPNEIDKNAARESMLREHPYFHGLDENDIRYVLRHTKMVSFEPGDVIYKQGDSVKPGEGVIFVTDGRARVSLKGASDITPGAAMGDWALLLEEPRSATVTVAGSEPLIGFEVDPEAFTYLLKLRESRHDLKARALFTKDTIGTFNKFFNKVMGRVPPETTKTIMALVSPGAKMLGFTPGSTIFKEGEDSSSGVFLVTNGYCRVLVNDGEEIAHIMPDNIAGEMAVLDNTTRRATVKAGRNGVSGILMTAEAFSNLVQYYPALRNGLVHMTAERKKERIAA